MPTIYNKVELDGTTLLDLSQDTASSASHIRNGYTAHLNDGTQVTGTFGAGAEYTRTVVCPQQTVSSSSRVANLSGFDAGMIDGDYYIITYDGTEYICTAETQWGSAMVVGDFNIYYSVPNEYNYPFAIGATISGADRDIAMLNTSQHTVKVEHLEFVSEGTTLTTKNITANGTYSASSDSADGYSSVTVNVSSSPTIQSLSITPSTSQQTFNASNVDGYKPVTVAAMTTMTLPTSAASSATSGYTSKATIGRSTAAQYINIPPGYNSTGAYYTISAVANGSATAPASISGTAASVSTGTNTLTLTKTVSVTPTVSAGYISSGTAGNSSVSLTASVTTKAAATITPTTTNQTIAAGTYLTGTQTIAGDADLVGSNIISTANIFGVQGTVVLQTVYTGSSAPGSSTGSNGDIYIQS